MAANPLLDLIDVLVILFTFVLEVILIISRRNIYNLIMKSGKAEMKKEFDLKIDQAIGIWN